MKRSLVLSVVASSFLALAVGAPPAPAAPKAYKVVAVSNGVTVRGVVKLAGETTLDPVAINKDNDKGCGDKQRPSERLEYDKETLGVGNAVVYLKDIAAGKDWPLAMKDESRTGTIDQKGCRYIPHVQWVRPETQMVILNNDGALHNIHGFSTPEGENSLKETKFNFASEPGSKKDEVAAAFLEQSGAYLVKCDVHPWMSAYVFVATNPYYATTVAKAEGALRPGEFVLTDVPPGEYTLVVWKEGMIEKPREADGKISSYEYSPNFVFSKTITVETGKECIVEEIKVPVQNK